MVRATIEAYGEGEIELPKVPKNTDPKLIREATNTALQVRQYTKSTVAEFLGWTVHRVNAKTPQPDYKCSVAFKAMDLIDATQKGG